MRFSFLSLQASLVATSASARLFLAFDETPCTAGLVDKIDVGEVCNANRIRRQLRNAYSGTDCDWSFNYEVRLLTQTLDDKKANRVLAGLCEHAEAAIWTSAEYANWTQVHGDFTPDFMDLYTEGGTYLNDETGNFRNRDGSDPRENRFYPTDQLSYDAGLGIDNFYNDGARSKILEPVDHLETCDNQAIMCCFGRDRQYRDGNGDCGRRNCDDANPGDNSNICYQNGDTPQALPDDETVHCHGLTWSSDDSDASYRLRFNNFFFVLMHDHMYTRGYVSPAVLGASMCGCVEDMNPVSRADCSEVDMNVNYFLSLDSATVALSVTPENLEFGFRACRGVTADGDRENNDLASKVNALVATGDMEEATKDNLFKVLVGHDEPNDNGNQPACEAAWNVAMPDAPYV